ncbi:hypothetical protein [Janibacter sp. HTCC2649]|uniref:hypothetical protein n=1 Tax=Janibacter sp. HTCC2649 TaxID=313589 RepID=UPI0002E88CD5|nr:hypothetical protein [Janibacter sp. HTCC2649]
MDSSDERSALAWIMSGTVGAVVAAGLGKVLMDRRRARIAADVESHTDSDEQAEAEGHPS